MKRYILVFGLVLVVSLLGLAACGIDPCDDPAAGDCYYLKHDSGYATSQAILQQNEYAIDRMTQEAQWTPEPTIAVYVQTPGPTALELVFCARVETNLYQAIIVANKGSYPPEVFSGMGVQVGYPNADDTEVVIELLAQAMENDPLLHYGDKICISVNPDLIRAEIESSLP